MRNSQGSHSIRSKTPTPPSIKIDKKNLNSRRESRLHGYKRRSLEDDDPHSILSTSNNRLFPTPTDEMYHYASTDDQKQSDSQTSMYSFVKTQFNPNADNNSTYKTPTPPIFHHHLSSSPKMSLKYSRDITDHRISITNPTSSEITLQSPTVTSPSSISRHLLTSDMHSSTNKSKKSKKKSVIKRILGRRKSKSKDTKVLKMIASIEQSKDEKKAKKKTKMSKKKKKNDQRISRSRSPGYFLKRAKNKMLPPKRKSKESNTLHTPLQSCDIPPPPPLPTLNRTSNPSLFASTISGIKDSNYHSPPAKRKKMKKKYKSKIVSGDKSKKHKYLQLQTPMDYQLTRSSSMNNANEFNDDDVRLRSNAFANLIQKRKQSSKYMRTNTFIDRKINRLRFQMESMEYQTQLRHQNTMRDVNQIECKIARVDHDLCMHKKLREQSKNKSIARHSVFDSLEIAIANLMENTESMKNMLQTLDLRMSIINTRQNNIFQHIAETRSLIEQSTNTVNADDERHIRNTSNYTTTTTPSMSPVDEEMPAAVVGFPVLRSKHQRSRSQQSSLRSLSDMLQQKSQQIFLSTYDSEEDMIDDVLNPSSVTYKKLISVISPELLNADIGTAPSGRPFIVPGNGSTEETVYSTTMIVNNSHSYYDEQMKSSSDGTVHVIDDESLSESKSESELEVDVHNHKCRKNASAGHMRSSVENLQSITAELESDVNLEYKRTNSMTCELSSDNEQSITVAMESNDYESTDEESSTSSSSFSTMSDMDNYDPHELKENEEQKHEKIPSVINVAHFDSYSEISELSKLRRMSRPLVNRDISVSHSLEACEILTLNKDVSVVHAVETVQFMNCSFYLHSLPNSQTICELIDDDYNDMHCFIISIFNNTTAHDLFFKTSEMFASDDKLHFFRPSSSKSTDDESETPSVVSDECHSDDHIAPIEEMHFADVNIQRGRHYTGYMVFEAYPWSEPQLMDAVVESNNINVPFMNSFINSRNHSRNASLSSAHSNSTRVSCPATPHAKDFMTLSVLNPIQEENQYQNQLQFITKLDIKQQSAVEDNSSDNDDNDDTSIVLSTNEFKGRSKEKNESISLKLQNFSNNPSTLNKIRRASLSQSRSVTVNYPTSGRPHIILTPNELNKNTPSEYEPSITSLLERELENEHQILKLNMNDDLHDLIDIIIGWDIEISNGDSSLNTFNCYLKFHSYSQPQFYKNKLVDVQSLQKFAFGGSQGLQLEGGVSDELFANVDVHRFSDIHPQICFTISYPQSKTRVSVEKDVIFNELKENDINSGPIANVNAPFLSID